MKSLIKTLVLLIMLNTISVIIPQRATAQISVSFQVFYDDLSPYGLWVNYPNYGYVWVPNYGPEFMPYSSNGHWVFTDYGWTWVSDYPWGWAPFHYGRWDYDDYYGWIWMPDNIWGPAWVCWRTSPNYYGWAPLGPNISLTIALGGGYNPSHDHWIFVNEQYMGRNDIYNYYGPRKNNTTYINNSTVINNTYVDNRSNTTYIAGPKREDVEKARGSKIKPISIKESTEHGQSLKNDELSIYKPAISKTTNVNPKPTKIADKKEVKPVSERKSQQEPKDIKLKKQEQQPKIVQPKEEIKKPQQQQVPQEQRKQEQPKIVQPKMIERKSQPPRQEQRKQEQPQKIIQPKIKENKNQAPPSRKEKVK